MGLVVENELGIFTSDAAADRSQKWHQSGLRSLHKIPGRPSRVEDLISWAKNVDVLTVLNQKKELQLERSEKSIWALDLVLEDCLNTDTSQLDTLIHNYSEKTDGYLVPVLAYFLGAMDQSSQAGQTVQAEAYWALCQEIMNRPLIKAAESVPQIYPEAVSFLVDQGKMGAMILFVDGLNLNINKHTKPLTGIDSNKKRFERILPVIKLPQKDRFEEMIRQLSGREQPSLEEIVWSFDLNIAFLKKQKEQNPYISPNLDNELMFFEAINLGVISGDYSCAAFHFINMAALGNRVIHYQDAFISDEDLKQYFKNQLIGLNAQQKLFPVNSLEKYITAAKNFTRFIDERINMPGYPRTELLMNVITSLFRYNARIHTINSQQKFKNLSENDRRALQSSKGTFLERDLNVDFEVALNTLIASYY